MITSSAPATHSPHRRHPDLRPIPPAAAARLLTAEAAPVYRCADSSPMRINDLGARARCRGTAVPMRACVHLSTVGSRRTAVPMPLGRTAVPTVSSTWCYTMQ